MSSSPKAMDAGGSLARLSTAGRVAGMAYSAIGVAASAIHVTVMAAPMSRKLSKLGTARGAVPARVRLPELCVALRAAQWAA